MKDHWDKFRLAFEREKLIKTGKVKGLSAIAMQKNQYFTSQFINNYNQELSLGSNYGFNEKKKDILNTRGVKMQFLYFDSFCSMPSGLFHFLKEG